MSFLAPAFLWALPLLAAPVIIHLFSRRQRDVIRWGAMDFLMASATPRRRFLRLRDLILLLLRILVALLIIAALAQPLLRSGWLGTTGPRDVILVLDNSMSTSRKIGGSTVFERELDEAARLIGKLSAADRLRVLLASPTPEWLLDSPVSADGDGRSSVMTRLRQLTPTDSSADMIECAQTAIKADPAARDTPKFITILTDGQAYGWRAGASGAWAAIRSLAEKASPPVFATVFVAGERSAALVNLAVETMGASRAVAGAGQPVAFKVSVRNTGASTSEPSVLSWSAGGQSLGVSAVPALEPGASDTIVMSQPFPTPGLVEVSCQLTAPDDIAADNSARFYLEVMPSAPILVAQGEPRADPLESDTQYFLSALGVGGETNSARPGGSVFAPKLVEYQQLGAEDFSKFRCVVLANVPRLSADVIQKLARYVSSGGGLWIALGDQTDIAAFNKLFVEQTPGLAPLPLLQPIGDAEDREKFTGVAPPSPEHPATALLADLQRLDIDRARVYRRHQFDAETGSGVTTLLRLEGGATLAAQKNLGRGRIIVQAIPLGLAWSNFPLCHSYVVMAHEWLWFLCEPGLTKRNLRPGELLQTAVPVEASNGSATLELPGGRNAQLVGLEEDGRLVFRYTKTLAPGEYRLAVHGSQETRTERYWVGRDPEESNLTPLSDEETTKLSQAGGLAFGGEALRAPKGDQRAVSPPKKLAEWLLGALLLFMAAETAVAYFFGRARRAPMKPITLEL